MASVSSKNQEANSGSTQEAEEHHRLQRRLLSLVTNTQTAAEAKEVRRRAELEEVRRVRYQQLEEKHGIKARQEIIDAMVRKWSTATEEDVPQELLVEFNTKHQLYASIVEDKKKHINATLQKQKAVDERLVRELRKNEEELDLMMKKSEDHIKILTKANREELCQLERILLEESEILLIRERAEWEPLLKKLWETELKKLEERRMKVEEYEVMIQNLRLGHRRKIDERNRDKVRERARHDSAIRLELLLSVRDSNNVRLDTFDLHRLKRRIYRLQIDLRDSLSQLESQRKEFAKRDQNFDKNYKRSGKQYERMQQRIEPFVRDHARRFKQMWEAADAEVKQLVERVLDIDSQIHKKLGLPWERPPLPFMEYSGPIQPQKETRSPAHQALSEVSETGQALQSESSAENEEKKLLMMKKVMELLCDEAGFLMEDKLLALLISEEKEERTVTKLCSLLFVFGIKEEDIPKLAHFFLKYKHQQREQEIEDIYVEPGKSSDKEEEVELIDANHAVPALKSFLEQHMKESQARQHLSCHLEPRDTSADEAYWKSMGNVISEDKLKLWDTAEQALRQYTTVLTDIADLIPETQRLERENKELKMLLQNCSVDEEEK